MDTDDVSSLADHLNRAANEIIDTAHDLRRSANRLNGKWHGGRSDQFLRRLSSAVNAAENVAEDATRLSHRVRAEVDEWLEADREGAGRVRGAVAPLPTPVPTPTPLPGFRPGVGVPRPTPAPTPTPPEWWDPSLGPIPEFIFEEGGGFALDLLIEFGIKNPELAFSIGLALPVIEQWVQNFDNPDRDEFWDRTANMVDALVTVTLVGSYTLAGMELGVLIGALTGVVNIPLGFGVAIKTSAILGAIGGYLGQVAADGYADSELRIKLIDSIVNLIRPPNDPSTMPQPVVSGGGVSGGGGGGGGSGAW
jgi:hypothetical protein